MAFGLFQLLGGETVSREEQKNQCSKHPSTDWNETSCSIEYSDIHIKYLFLKFMNGFNYDKGFPYARDGNQSYHNPNEVLQKFGLHQYLFDEIDNCVLISTKLCLEQFFNGSKAHDILIFSVGLEYWNIAWHPVNAIIDMDEWIRSSAAAFRANLLHIFKGTIFRMTLSPFRGIYFRRNPGVAKVNEILWDEWGEVIDRKFTNRWFTIDQNAINEGRLDQYSDSVHFPGNLTFATLFQVLNAMCPNGGDKEFLIRRCVNGSNVIEHSVHKSLSQFS
jgi:hypothetical protein